MSEEINKSGLQPFGKAVLVRPYEPEIKRGIIEIPDTVKERTAMVETRAVIIAIGPEAWSDEKAPRAKVGDKVFITKYAGFMAKGELDGQTYRIVNDRDIFCGLFSETVA